MESEPTTNKTPTNAAPAARHPVQLLAACLPRRVAKRLLRGRRTKSAKIKTFFRRRAQKILSIKETIFASFVLLLEQGRAASHPTAALRAAEQAGKNSFSPHPFFFLPVCLSFAMKFFSGAKNSNGFTVLFVFGK
jgi:hypothetical protein